MIIFKDKKYNFWELFNEQNGTLIRSNVYGSKENPFMRSFPELIDVGIMGKCVFGGKGVCEAAGVDCYQKGAESKKDNMRLVDYKTIVEEANGKTFQIALGGAGDPNKHSNFGDILRITRENKIVPNLTTSGINMTDEEIGLMKKYCGAVAVSYYSRLLNGRETNEQTVSAISKLRDIVPTNIHYIISKDSIEEAIYRMDNDIWVEGINAIIFLLYKPVGFGKAEKTNISREHMDTFMKSALEKNHPYRVGFDTCFTPIILDYDEYFEIESIDSCEAARFSMYIDSEMFAYPCSFDNQKGKYKISLKQASIQEVWNSTIFNQFRNQESSCCDCKNYGLCRGGCGLDLGINRGYNCHIF